MGSNKLLWLKVFLPLAVLLFSACSGPGSGSGAAPSFDISLSPTSLTVVQGSSGQTTLTLTPQNGFTGTVSLSLVNPPAGVSLSPSSVTVSGNSPVNQDLTISTTANTPTGQHTLTLKATLGGIERTATLTLAVNQATTPSFTLSLNPTSLTVVQGGSGQATLTLTPQNGFTGTVSLSLVNPPAGVSLSPSSVTVSGNSPVNQDLTISTTANTPTGQHTLTLKATSGSTQKTATLTLAVNTFTVNTTADTIDASPADGSCADANGNCSLRAAIMEANALNLNTPVVINIPADTYQLTLTNGAEEERGDLDIRRDVTLRGAGAGQTILDGNAADRVLEIYEGATVSVEGVTIQNGKAVNDNGGGILNSGTLTLKDSTVSENTAIGNTNNNGHGGGIYNDSTGTLTLTNSTVSGNTASDGGGIYNYRGTLTLTDSTVSGNRATGSNSGGGGIFNYEGTLTLTNSTVSGNAASDGAGGGILNYEGTLNLTDSTVSENTANYGGGGIASLGTLTLTNSTVSGNAASGGGGIASLGTLTLTNSTVSGNAVSGGGGGVYVYSGTANLSFSTLTGNQATSAGGGIYIDSGTGTVQLKGVILAGNTSGGSGPECSGSLTSQGYNLIKDDAGCTVEQPQSTDITGQDPLLGPLADNGGPTKTHLPAEGSPVLDRVPTEHCTLTTDQRGVSRPQPQDQQDAKCDIGAVERRAVEGQ